MTEPIITCIEDLRLLAKQRVPRMFYDYADSGAWTESTYRANETDFQRIHLRQRVGIDFSNRSLASSMVGQPVSMPVALAPVGLAGMQHADGEILAARAAAAAGLPFTLSTMSICSIEDVAENTDKPFWFQLYVMKDREFNDRLIGRAKAAGCSALVLTLDLQILGQRHKDLKNGLTAPPKMTLANLIDIASKPRWWMGILGTRRRTFRNIVGHVQGVKDTRALGAWTAEQFDPTLNWDDVKRIRDRWGGKLILKGILDPEDAELAARSGADALIVSNHGGRQLDGALSSIAALPPIVKAVGSRIEVLMDGGIRSGQDVLKALALGAKGVCIGRSYIYGLGAMGEAGVTQALEIIRKELDITMALCGLRDIKQASPDILVKPNT
ncbi:MAG: alpha-hydroxy-acid oxidizing protein [Hyphomonadaceae bacterium]|nr:alpha-hydroxy-acid oxidizing protein [Hyphomonadaceae bacterium]